MLRDVKKTSYRAKPVSSPSMYDTWGYPNKFGGFHSNTDTYAYVGLLGFILKYIWNPKVVKYTLYLMRRRWVHRKCDTTDFHHEIYCTLDPYGKMLDNNYRWHRVWTS